MPLIIWLHWVEYNGVHLWEDVNNNNNLILLHVFHYTTRLAIRLDR